MNAINAFEKDHLAAFIFLKTLLFTAFTAGASEAIGYINGSGVAGFRTMVTVFASGFVIAVLHYVTSYFSKSPDPQIAMAATVADTIVTKEEPKIRQAVQTYNGHPLQPVKGSSPAAFGTQIANGFVAPTYQSQADITQMKTAQIPVSFPMPNQAPVAPTSAFHELLQTEVTPIVPAAQLPPQSDAWLNTTPKQG